MVFYSYNPTGEVKRFRKTNSIVTMAQKTLFLS